MIPQHKHIFLQTLKKELMLQVIPLPEAPAIETLTIEKGDYNWLTCIVTTEHFPLLTVSWFTHENGAETFITTTRY